MSRGTHTSIYFKDAKFLRWLQSHSASLNQSLSELVESCCKELLEGPFNEMSETSIQSHRQSDSDVP